MIQKHDPDMTQKRYKTFLSARNRKANIWNLAQTEQEIETVAISASVGMNLALLC